MSKTGIGIIGCGNISNAYVNGTRIFDFLELVSCADIRMDAAEAKAKEHGIKAVGIDEMLADPKIQIVINLTIPKVHADVSVMILKSGKHVHCEKPLAVTREDGRKVLKAAKDRKLRVGCAPDTFLGAGHQTARKIIDDGWIGKPLCGTAFMMGHGPEAWHPNPFFFYELGGGPMFDMGPYYMTDLVQLLGPVKSICAVTSAGFKKRMATSKAHFGKMLPVEIPTNYSGTMLFHSGAVINVCMSFDVWRHQHNPIEIYGTEGSMLVPDPNGFGGHVKVYRPGNENWQESVLTHAYAENSRGIAVADMALAIQEGRPHRCSGELAYHVLDIMHSFEDSSRSGKAVTLASRCERPEPMKTSTPQGMV